MELMQLEMFVAMVEEGSSHKAARRVLRTQPAVSIAIRKLESEIGASLFDRSNRSRYSLTETGATLFDYAKRMLSLRDESLLAVKELHNLRNGRLRIGANESTALYLLPRLIHQFRESYPKIKIEISRHVSSNLVAELRQREVDFIVISYLPQESADLEPIQIMRDDLILISNADHPLAKRETVRIAELGRESFIAHNVRSSSREKVVEAFQQSGTPLNITIEIATIETIKRFVSMNLGIAFVPRMCVQEELDRGDLATIRVEDFHYERILWLVRLKDEVPGPAARALITLAKLVQEERDRNANALELIEA